MAKSTTLAPVTAEQPRGWWRRNLWALIALPFVVALVLGLGAYRVYTFWWTTHLTEASHAPVGGTATLTDSFEDAQGERSRTVTMGAGPAEVVTTYPGFSGEMLPVDEVPGTQVWRFELHVEAAPDQVLSACQVEMVDDQGRTFPVRNSLIGWELPQDLCVPDGLPGPQYDLGDMWADLMDEEESTEPRPETYSVPVYVRLTDGATPAQAKVYWAVPKYLALDLAPAD